MRKLNRKAQIYIFSTIIAGIVLLAWSLAHYQFPGTWMMLVLSGLASLALIFKVEGSTDRSHYNISFLIYAFSFLELGLDKAIVVIVLSNLAEWAWYKYPWYIPLFNAFSLSLVMALSGQVSALAQAAVPYSALNDVAIDLLALIVFTVFNHLMVGLVIWFARQENFIQSGVFAFFSLLFDFILLCMGAGLVTVWDTNPYAVILAILPLYLVYSTSKVPALERKTEMDPKTGVFNASYFNQTLENELKRSNRFDRPMTVVMADMDLLRNINNTYGHLAGDEVLIGVANILKRSVREYDVVARFGGEEFVILMPETRAEEVFEHIEDIRKKIEQAEFTVQTSVTPIKVTMSFGIAGRQGIDQTSRQLIHNADAALYHSKLKGRNRVYIYTESGYQELFKTAEGAGAEQANPSLPGSLDEMPIPVLEVAPAAPMEYPAAQLIQPAGDPGLSVKGKPAPDQEPTPPAAQKPAGETAPRIRNRFSAEHIVGAMLLASVLLFCATLPFSVRIDWVGLALFAAVVGWTEWLSIDIYVRDTSVSTSAAPMLAGFLLFGPVGVALLSLVLAGVAMIKHRSRLRSFLFNTSNQMIAGLLCAGFVILAGNSFIGLARWQQLLISVIASAVIYGSTTGLIAVGMSLDHGASIREIWVEKFSWLGLYYLGMGVLAFVLIFCFQTFGPSGILVILGPLLVLRFGQAQYIDRTRTVVRELKEKNLALQKSAAEISKLNEGLLNALAEVVDLRDPYVLGHSKQVARIAELLAHRLGLSPYQAGLIHKAGLLHDIGKLGIPEAILSKPGKLDQQEFSIMRRHTTVGAEILKSSHTLHDLIPVIYHHHERFDGSGYPDGLKGNEASIEARIVAVADAVDAMASDRPYQRGRELDEIVAELERCSGTQFDPQVVAAFSGLARDMGSALITSPLQEAAVSVEP